MAHMGIISPPVSGHLNPFAALGRTLMKRGHRVTVFQQADVEPKAKSEGLDFAAIGQSDHPKGSLPDNLSRLSQLKGLTALRFTVQLIKRTTEMFCRDLPGAVTNAGIDLLLVDQTEPAGGVVASHLNIPYVTVCNAMAINRESTTPPIFTGWEYSPAVWAQIRNDVGYRTWDFMMRPITDVLVRYRRDWSLPRINTSEDHFSTLAQLSQQPAAFDFPRRQLPRSFHYLGPFRNPHPDEAPFPWDRLDGRPVIYSSLGTIQNRSASLFRCIAEACDGLPYQLVLSHAGGLSDDATSGWPGKPLVVRHVPQQALLAKAKLAISHAGLNTVLDSLSQGVPVVAMPLTYEQPAIAARLRWAGAGQVVSFAKLSVPLLRQTVQNVLNSPACYAAAGRIAESIRQAGGVERAADIVEEVLQTGRPVLTP